MEYLEPAIRASLKILPDRSRIEGRDRNNLLRAGCPRMFAFESAGAAAQAQTTMKPAELPAAVDSSSTTRRQFLAAGLAAGAAALTEIPPVAQAAITRASPLLPTIKLGSHSVARLIIGGNPIYGYSHFNKLLSQHQTAWHTPERVVELLQRCERAGINTWQNSFAERTLADLERFREAGGKLQWLCLGKPDWDEHPEHIDEVVKRHPLGIAPHGAL